MLAKDSITTILNAGGHLRIKTMNADSLVEFANIARMRKVNLEIRGTMALDTILAVVNAGGGQVTWDISD